MRITKARIGLRQVQLALSAFLVISAALSARAQGINPGSRTVTTGSGTNTIQGRVLFPPGQGSGTRVKVSLEGINSFSSQSTATDQDGVFRFQGISAGSYSVVVDAGSQFEKAREPITIDPEASGRVAQVVVELHFKVDASNPAFAGVPQNAWPALRTVRMIISLTSTSAGWSIA